MNLGLLPRKSWSNSGFPDFAKTEQKFLQQFILGYFEGDGNISIFIKKKKKENKVVGQWAIMGQEKFIFELKKILEEALGEHFCVSSIKRKTENCTKLYNIQTNKESTLIKLYHWLYKDASFAMQRKHDKWTSILTSFKENGLDVGEIYKFQDCVKVEILLKTP